MTILQTRGLVTLTGAFTCKGTCYEQSHDGSMKDHLSCKLTLELLHTYRWRLARFCEREKAR